MSQFNMETLQKDFYYLLNEIEKKLKTEWSAKYVDVVGGKEIISTFIGTSKTLYKTIIFLCLDKVDDIERDSYYVLSTPQLNRSLMEILFSMIYLLEDFPTHCKLFFKYLLTEKEQKLDALKENFSGIQKWDHYLKDQYIKLAKFKCDIEKYLSLTKDEKKKLGNAILQSPHFPSPSRIIKRLNYSDSDNLNILEFLNSTLYMELSSMSHLAPSGVIDFSKFHLPTNENIFFYENSIKSKTDEIQKFRQEQLCISFGLMLALYSEIELNFNYGYKENLNILWLRFNEIGNDFIKELYMQRYCEILTK